MLQAHRDYRAFLKQELEVRCKRNPRYSLRCFARDLGLSSSRLSEVMTGKSGISRERAKAIGILVGLENSRLDLFCDLVEAQHARSTIKRELAKKRLLKYEAPHHTELQIDTFRVISDWYHYAILELTYLPGFESTSSWISSSLGISPTEARLAVERLLRLNLLIKENGKLRAREDFTTSTDGVPSDAIRKFHKQLLDKALAAIEGQPTHVRNFSSVILAFDSNKYDEAVDRLKKFRRQFNHEFSATKAADGVYCLGIQFFRLSESGSISLKGKVDL